MRAYTVAAAAVTLGIPAKWIDNTLSHNKITGVIQTRQGITRKLSPQAVVILEISLQLGRILSIPLPRALALAEQLTLIGGPDARLNLGGSVTLAMNVTAIEHSTHACLAQAVEITPTPARGRPRKRDGAPFGRPI